MLPFLVGQQKACHNCSSSCFDCLTGTRWHRIWNSFRKCPDRVYITAFVSYVWSFYTLGVHLYLIFFTHLKKMQKKACGNISGTCNTEHTKHASEIEEHLIWSLGDKKWQRLEQKQIEKRKWWRGQSFATATANQWLWEEVAPAWVSQGVTGCQLTLVSYANVVSTRAGPIKC